MSSSRNRRNYSQSVSLRKVAHQVLTSEECQTFKEALKVFRTTQTPEQLVDRLEPLLDSPKKLNLLREIVLLLPAEQRPQFAALCRSRFKGAELLLQDNHIAAEFEQRFGQKMASLSIDGKGGGAAGSGGTNRSVLVRRTSAVGDLDGDRRSLMDKANSTVWINDATAAAAAAAAAARRLRAAADRAAKERITLSDSAQIRKLSDEKAASVIKLRSATFQVRYRSKLPLFASLPEEEPPISASTAATAAAAAPPPGSSRRYFGNNTDTDSDNEDSDSDEDRLVEAAAATVAAKSRLPLADLSDKGFWALNSPRRALEEKRKQQAAELASAARDGEEHRNRRRHRRQRHQAKQQARLPEASVVDESSGEAVAAARGSFGSRKSSSADTPAAEDSQIYRLLYAPSTAANRAEDQASLTSSTLEVEFLKTRQLSSAAAGIPASLAEDFDDAQPVSLDSSGGLSVGTRRRLYGLPDRAPPAAAAAAAVATADSAVQCDIAGDFSHTSQLPTKPHQASISIAQHPPSIGGFYFVPMSAAYPGSHALHHAMSAASPMSAIAGGGYFPWSHFWSQSLLQLQRQQEQHESAAGSFCLGRPPRQPQNSAKSSTKDDGMRRVTLMKDAATASFGFSVRFASERELRRPLQRSPFVVASVVTGSPAHGEGLQPGDQLLELEGQQVANMTLQQLGLAVRSRQQIQLCLMPAALDAVEVDGGLSQD